MLLLLLLLSSLRGSQSQKEGYKLEVSLSETVQEGLCIYIPCTFFYPDSWIRTRSTMIYGYWFRKGSYFLEDVLVATNDQNKKVEKEDVGRFHLVGDPMEDNCSLRITDVQKKDEGRYFFRMESWIEKFSYLYYQVTLNVRALTQKPDIFIPGILEPGHSVTLMCAAPWVCREGTPPTFSWTGAALSNRGPSRETPYFSELTFIPTSQDHGIRVTCRMTFPGAGVSTETTVPLNVACVESSLNFSILKDESLRLLCRADSNPPAILSWAHGGRAVLSSWSSDAGTLVLQLPHLGVKDGGEYSCRAQHRMETQHASLNLSVLYAPENLKVNALGPNRTVAILGNASSLVVLVGESLQLECVAESSPPAYMNWAKGSQPLNSSLPSSPGILCLELAHVQPGDGGEYTCQAQNPWGTQHISLNLSVQYPPRLFDPFCSWADEGLLCTCCIQAEPTPSLIWWVGERTVEDNGNNDLLQVMSTTSGAWTNSSLILREKWDLDLSLRCEGRNQHGAHSLLVLMVSDRTSIAALEFSKGALLGAGIMALLILCLVLAYKKFLRMKQLETGEVGITDSQSNMEADYVNLDMKQGRIPRPPPSDPVTQAPPEELHYASINFRRPNLKNPEESTEYSEVKF
ncbi:sialic acid-binding Ig-like lectin 10 isoform X2 [Phascolarctos cinereus]|uniref:Sialic acid-binding Ig-like lectin 10 isoform X2 n=1 Tax=Phascolarctos cinereus TaxID=38626 RepID=A0A6P5LUX0_PHACI|nr:sialic acid-binding Ig-like lectin 10 isoform X2 [Phascolarctos cinereus]